MSTPTVRDSRNRAVESFSATTAKNAFGTVLERALTKGMVTITKRDKARAVLLSMEEYEALLERAPDPLKTLGAEFDALVKRMQSPKARAAGKALFKATSAKLGKAAVAGARKRG
ncbi:MAG TPA: type II toxin-antitoxin system Phd/YefM family antitoxin [Gammaproteobacteria bacterium]|nr:type II toxin-antitoxin system Phd/YefM family antitoxin [Gammaproteobacteria bacterium]